MAIRNHSVGYHHFWRIRNGDPKIIQSAIIFFEGSEMAIQNHSVAIIIFEGSEMAIQNHSVGYHHLWRIRNGDPKIIQSAIIFFEGSEMAIQNHSVAIIIFEGSGMAIQNHSVGYHLLWRIRNGDPKSFSCYQHLWRIRNGYPKSFGRLSSSLKDQEWRSKIIQSAIISSKRSEIAIQKLFFRLSSSLTDQKWRSENHSVGYHQITPKEFICRYWKHL